MTWDTLLIDGVDMSNLFTVVEVWEGMESASGMTGSNYKAPGRDGEVWRRKARDAGQVSIGIAVLPTDPVTGVEPVTEDGRLAQFNANLLTIKRLVGSRRRMLRLSRRLSLPDGNITIAARAELASPLASARIATAAGRLVLSFRLLDGVWFSEVPSEYTVTSLSPSFLPPVGTTDTYNMTVTLTGGVGNQVLTNVSAGSWLSYDWTTRPPGSTVIVNVPAFTVTRSLDGVSYSSLNTFKHAGDPRFLVIDPDLGDNQFTISSGQAVISYRGAWL